VVRSYILDNLKHDPR